MKQTQAETQETQAQETQAETQAQAETKQEITIAQVMRALYNGNNKKQESGNIPQGLHKVEDIRKKYKAEKIPAGLSEKASAVYIAQNNLIAQITPAGLEINTSALDNLTEIQKTALNFITAQAQKAGKQITEIEIAWQGKAGKPADKEKALNNRIAGLFM